jgi:hypothetical protein
MASMMWGYGTSAGYGPARTLNALTSHSDVGTELAEAIRLVSSGEPGDLQSAYENFSLKPCGVVYRTKFFFAIGLGTNSRPIPLVLDSVVGRKLRALNGDNGFDPSAFVKVAQNGKTLTWFPSGYIEYVKEMDRWAQELGCRADGIELFLFES